PVGVAGELYLGGPGVALGYLNRGALTAGSFLPDPFGPAGSWMYRTGDVCRLLADGNLEYLGRRDNQVKVRGYRIAPDEIAARLSEHAGVADAVVCDRTTYNGHHTLVAYVVPAAGADTAPDDLDVWAAGTLPDYMVPAHVVALDALPRNANGKIDRKRLPDPR